MRACSRPWQSNKRCGASTPRSCLSSGRPRCLCSRGTPPSSCWVVTSPTTSSSVCDFSFWTEGLFIVWSNCVLLFLKNICWSIYTQNVALYTWEYVWFYHSPLSINRFISTQVFTMSTVSFCFLGSSWKERCRDPCDLEHLHWTYKHPAKQQ